MKLPCRKHINSAKVSLGLFILIIEVRMVRNTSGSLVITIINMNLKIVIIITIILREANKCLLVSHQRG